MKIIVFIDLTKKFLEQYAFAVKDMWCDEMKYWNLNWTSFKGKDAKKERDEFIAEIKKAQEKLTHEIK
jgi:hypothetical protein